MLICVFMLFVLAKSFRKKKIKRFEIALMTSFTLLLKAKRQKILEEKLRNSLTLN